MNKLREIIKEIVKHYQLTGFGNGDIEDNLYTSPSGAMISFYCSPDGDAIEISYKTKHEIKGWTTNVESFSAIVGDAITKKEMFEAYEDAAERTDVAGKSLTEHYSKTVHKNKEIINEK